MNFQLNDSLHFHVLKQLYFYNMYCNSKLIWSDVFTNISMLLMISLIWLNLLCVYSPWLRKPPQVGVPRWNQWADATPPREGPEDLLEPANSRKVQTLTMCQMTLQLPKQQTTNPQKTNQPKGAGTSLLSRTVNDRGCPRGTRVFPTTMKPTKRFVVMVLRNYGPCFVCIGGSKIYYRMIIQRFKHH